MPVYEEEPIAERRVVEPDRTNSGLAGYALVKYGFILAITIVILYFLANYVLNRF
ncbi:MAG TPA: hypothetical protein VHI31_02990 [Actinomycetota bacterium]|nr:hypothetical protein [Actinomycetota bacterium]